MVMRAGHQSRKMLPLLEGHARVMVIGIIHLLEHSLCLIYAKEVADMKIDETPGIIFRRGCTRHSYEWLPIAPSPIASRTRTKMKS